MKNLKKIVDRISLYNDHPYRFSLLLFFIVLKIILYPVVKVSGIGINLLNVASTFVLIAAVIAIGQDKKHLRWALVLGTLALSGIWYVKIFPEMDLATPVIIVALVSLIAFEAMVIKMILASVISAKEVTVDTISGAVAGYFLIGSAFSTIYLAIVILDPNAIIAGGISIGSIEYPVFTLQYYSYVTLTTLGYGDVIPISPFAKTAAFMEAAIGVLYMGILIASLVSVYFAANNESGD